MLVFLWKACSTMELLTPAIMALILQLYAIKSAVVLKYYRGYAQTWIKDLILFSSKQFKPFSFILFILQPHELPLHQVGETLAKDEHNLLVPNGQDRVSTHSETTSRSHSPSPS